MSYEDVTKQKIISSLQSNIAEALKNLNDPTTNENRQFIYMRQPRTAADSFEGYPYLYLDDYSVDSEQATVNGLIKNMEGEMEFVIDGIDDAQRSKVYHDKLADQLIETFLSEEVIALGSTKMSKIEIENDNRITTVTDTGKPVIRRTIAFSFRMQVDFSG